jgi:hypothetical protein
MLNGLLLKESLNDTSILGLVHVTKTESWQVKNAAPYQPATWTALSFEAEEKQADPLVEKMSQALKPQWYINASTATHVYVIFPSKVFKYRKGDSVQRAEAQRYGRSIGIPESQLDWSEQQAGWTK